MKRHLKCVLCLGIIGTAWGQTSAVSASDKTVDEQIADIVAAVNNGTYKVIPDPTDVLDTPNDEKIVLTNAAANIVALQELTRAESISRIHFYILNDMRSLVERHSGASSSEDRREIIAGLNALTMINVSRNEATQTSPETIQGDFTRHTYQITFGKHVELSGHFADADGSVNTSILLPSGGEEDPIHKVSVRSAGDAVLNALQSQLGGAPGDLTYSPYVAPGKDKPESLEHVYEPKGKDGRLKPLATIAPTEVMAQEVGSDRVVHVITFVAHPHIPTSDRSHLTDHKSAAGTVRGMPRSFRQ